MALGTALVDRARVVWREPAGPRVDGRTPFEDVHGEWFKARLTVPSTTESADPAGARRRVPVAPTLMYGVRDLAGGPVEVNSNQRVEVDSPQLGRDVWDVVSEPEPMRKRRTIIGWIATIRRVED